MSKCVKKFKYPTTCLGQARTSFSKSAMMSSHISFSVPIGLSGIKFFPLALSLVDWMRRAMVSMDLGYLRTLVLFVYLDPNEPNDVLEAYSFTFNPSGEQLLVGLVLSQCRTLVSLHLYLVGFCVAPLLKILTFI